jgi:hypothetical protein
MTYSEVPDLSSRPSKVAPVARQVRFVSERPEPAIVVRTYEEPRQAWAVEGGQEASAIVDFGSKPDGNECIVTLMSTGAPTSPVAAQERSPRVVAKRGRETVEWRPGAAIVRCERTSQEDVIPAVVDFAFFEGELRSLERFLKSAEPQARLDLPTAHRLTSRDKAKWAEIGQRLEPVAGARLTFARLEPQFSAGARSLGVVGRSWFSRLCRRAWIEERLAAVNDRLEALEEFYAASTQRISEYRWYREGHFLETGIIGILLVECLLMIGDIVVHLRR